MFPVVMFVLQFLRCRLYLRIDQFTTTCHLGYFFQYNCIMNSLMSIFPPGKWSMVFAENSRYCIIIPVFEILGDQNTGISLIALIDFFFC